MSDRFVEYLGTPAARALILLTVTAFAVVVGLYLVGKMRSKLRETDPGPSDLLTNFRELHSQGELSDEEYRTIKAKLAASLQKRIEERLKDADHDA